MRTASCNKGLGGYKKDDPKLKGNTYALIAGISKYQANESYKNLQYADADAKEFYRYLVSEKGGKLTGRNVDTLFNENACFMEFWRKFNRIKEKLQKNDVFYIYFSGHGDAYRADEAYLLAYDAPAGNDRNNYSIGVGLIDTAAQYNKEPPLAETYYRKSLEKDPKNAAAYYQLATLYAATNPGDAVKNLLLAIEYGGYTKADIEADILFAALKEEKDFKEILQKLK
ncbi:MAG: caspase family protein [Rhizobacter sp.]|nr:caspase family protein [Ferruginibacter sp.]